ncbi:MAG TPA: substrate-binding domain-containing protein [Microvirga sp.]|nr:substrate-binding domain-containing protein [Microvirga sp.]
MRVELRLDGLIRVDGQEIALGPAYALLDGLAEEKSVRGAAARLGISYRSAWGRVLALEEALGRPVVVKTKGHGSVLTVFGAALRDTLGTTLSSFETLIGRQERTLADGLAALTGTVPPTMRLALSHDPLLLAALAEIPAVASSVVGSQEAVERLLSGRADAAGFHAGPLGPASSPAFDTLLRNPDFVVRPLFTREQGLMVAPGNPLGIRAVADLARSRARFVNRQRGSGTRAWFDRILRDAAISPLAIAGYEVEEFTHQAVAAVIAAGAADAGMGVRSVAERFGLGFVPLGREDYCIAGPPERIADLSEQLSPRISRLVAETGGYALPKVAPGRPREPPARTGKGSGKGRTPHR